VRLFHKTNIYRHRPEGRRRRRSTSTMSADHEEAYAETGNQAVSYTTGVPWP
jgi:saccharopine dehydrogenase-like NADP-dependent oxidoreductase